MVSLASSQVTPWSAERQTPAPDQSPPPPAQPAPVAAAEPDRQVLELLSAVHTVFKGDPAAVRVAVSAFLAGGHILLEDKTRADELFIQLQDGGNFAEVARNNSTDTGSGQQGGDLGCFGRGQMVGPFEEAAFGAEVGDTVGPVQSEFGYHIIRVYEKNPAVTTPFPEVREQVREQLVNQQLGTRITALREASGAELFPENLPTTAPAAPEPPSGTGSAEPAQPAAEPNAEPAAPVEGESEGESDH